jgi:beta-lactamase regulating signal transducer with metallopeptidase domain
MPPLFVILIKINLVLAFFAIAYFLILRRLTFYGLNRIFLVFGMLFSSLYPFIDLTDFFHTQQQLAPQLTAFVPVINQQVQELAPVGFMAKYGQLISILFYTGVVIMAVRFILQFVALYRLHKSSAKGLVSNMRVRILAEPVSPFSFWQTIYINPSLHTEKDVEAILAHEYIHVKQWHTLDIMLAELSVVFYWFNPGVWLMNKAVKENLEFITDETVLKRGVDKKAYQYSLLHTGNGVASATFTNSFSIADLKKRIQMMNARRSSPLTLSRYAFVLPVLLLTALLFTVSKKNVIKYFSPVVSQIVYLPATAARGNEPVTPTKRPAAKPAKAHNTPGAVLHLRADSMVAAGSNNDDHSTVPANAAVKTIPPDRARNLVVAYSLSLLAQQPEVITKDHWPQASFIDTMGTGNLVAMQPLTTGIRDVLVVRGIKADNKRMLLLRKGEERDENVRVVQGYPAPGSKESSKQVPALLQKPEVRLENVRVVQGHPIH